MFGRGKDRMNRDFTDGMAEATRMTRTGRLAEATALIQRLLSGRTAAAPGVPALPAPSGAQAGATAQPGPAVATREAKQGAAQGAATQAAATRGAGPRAVGRQAAAKQAAGRPAAGPRTGLRETVQRLIERARALDLRAPAAAPEVVEGARFETATFANAAGTRSYRLYVPAAGPQRRGRPLVLMLHGCTQDPDDFARGTAMNAAAEEAGAIVVYPGQPASANPKRCWNWFRPEDQAGDLGEAALLAGLVESVIAAEDADPARIYVAGISAGGAAAANLGMAYPGLFAAVGVHSGLPARAANNLATALGAMHGGARGARPERAVRTIVFHGDADAVVSPANAAAIVAQATAAAGPLAVRTEEGAAGGRSYSRTVHEDARGRAMCESWIVHGAGHVWSGGDPAGSHAEAAGPDASREMLRFFLQG